MRMFIFLILLLSPYSYSQENLTIFYFGATSCGPCNRPEVIKSIKKMRVDFDSLHKDYKTKFVMVCMDENIKEGLKFIEKYGYWDEISIGGWYNNELALVNLNKSAVPGVPHIFIYKETFAVDRYNIETIKTKELIKEIIGGDKIVNWAKSGFKLE